MNLFLVLTTSVIVSLDSFFVGFSVSLKEKQNLSLPPIVAAVTYVLCLIASIFGQKLSSVFTNGQYVGAAILLLLGIFNVLKKDQPHNSVSFTQNLATAVSVAADGTAAILSLAIQNECDVILTPLLFAATHCLTTILGQMTARKTHVHNVNVWTAVFLFALAAIKFLNI